MTRTGHRTPDRFRWARALIAGLIVGLFHSPATAAAGDERLPPEGVRVEAISQRLGLIEVIATPLGTDGRPPTLRATYAGAGSARAVTMRRDDRGLWVARVMRPAGRSIGPVPAEVTLRIHWDDAKATPSWTESLVPGAATPDWAKGAVWYQIMPERFDNGSPLNDPRHPGVYRPEWNEPWEVVTPGELESGWARAAALGQTLYPDQPGGALTSLVSSRRYGGDLQGVVDRLDHIAGLGITALCLTPIVHAPTAPKDDATDFRHIDPTLGSTGLVPREPTTDPRETIDPKTWRWTDADAYFLGVVLPRARAMGMRVIIDGVWSHTGVEFWAFRDALTLGSGSRYASWFDLRFDEAGRVAGWGASDGPSGRLPHFALQRDGNLVEPVAAHIADITARWMDPDGDGDPADGIDGWRLGAAGVVAPVLWKSWRGRVKSINPDAVLVGELWQPGGGLLEGDVLDASSNETVASEIAGWLVRREAMRSSDLARGLRLAQAPSASVGLCRVGRIGSHDDKRIWSMMANPDGVDGQGTRVIDGDADTIRRGLLGYALLATLPGSPMVDAGDEFGLRGGSDANNRRPVPWPDRGPYRGDDGPRTDLVERIGGWLRLRSDPTIGPILRLGGVRFLLSHDPGVFAFERFLNNQSVLIVVNRSDTPYDASALDVVPRADPIGGTPRRVPAMSARWWLIDAGRE